MVSIQAGDDLPSDSDAELQYSPERANGRGPLLSRAGYAKASHSPERQPIVSPLGGISSKSSSTEKATYPPPDFKDE